MTDDQPEVSEWMRETGSLIYLGVGQNLVPNAYCEQHGWIDSGMTYKGERPWSLVVAAVNEHLAREHPEET